MKDSLITTDSLKGFFYKQLERLNSKSCVPLPDEMIIYSSHVLEKYNNPESFTNTEEGQTTLGLKLLELQQLTPRERKEELFYIAETSIVMCGFFPQKSRKLIDVRYYEKVGRSAYFQINELVPSYFDYPLFFRKLSEAYERVTNLMNLISSDALSSDAFDQYLLLNNGSFKKIS